MSEEKARVNTLVLAVVENQLASRSPRETMETFDRLMTQGMSEEDAKHLIGSALAVEMRSVAMEGRPFRVDRYLTLLRDLPSLP